MAADHERLSPWRYDPEAGVWVQGFLHDSPAHQGASLRVVTWNVWFGEEAFDLRTWALLEALQRCDADVIALQEMTRRRLWQIAASPWVRARYALSDVLGDSLGDYGVVLASRLPILALHHERLPSRMGRSVLSATIRAGRHLVTVATTHLESLRPFAAERRMQMRLATDRLRSLDHDALLVGDMNLGPDENVSQETEGFDDLWPRLHDAQPGLTRDPAINVMRARNDPQTVPARLDRMLLRSPHAALRPTSLRLLGTSPIEGSNGELFISDHFGLQASFELR